MNVCVFCGSSPGRDPAYVKLARTMGNELARREVGLVYGGGQVGMMGAVADAALEAGGSVIGVIPGALVAKEVAHQGLTTLRVVDSMHERKQVMADLADGFVALPGGFGTLDEFFEICTWAQLGIHRKPFGLINVAGYFDRLIEFLDVIERERFVSEVHRKMVLIDDTPSALLDRFTSYRAPVTEKWLDREGR